MIGYSKSNDFRSWITKICSEAVGVIPVNPQFAEFLINTMPTEQAKQYYCLWVSDGEACAQKFFTSLEAYAQALTRVGQEHVMTFLTPVSVARDPDGKLARTRANAYKAACVCVDVDHIPELGECLAEVTDTAITQWVRNKINTAGVAIAPAWIVVSGHGLHMYWPTETIDLRDPVQAAEWQALREMLVAKLGGDWMALKITQPMRAPYSLNCKNPEAIVPVRLIRYGNNTRHTIGEFALPYDSDLVEAYHIRQLEAARVRRATKAGKSPEAAKAQPKREQWKTAPKQAKAPEESVPIYTQTLHPETHFHPGRRTLNCLRDLENWFVRRGGEIAGSKHMFSVIYASVCREGGMSEERAMERMANLFSPGDSCFEHTQKVVHRVYTGPAMTWREHYTTIAKILGWTEEEKRAAYAAFSPEEKQAKKQARDRRYYARKTSEARAAKTEREQIIVEAMQADAAEFGYLTESTLTYLMAETGLGERSIKNRWRDAMRSGAFEEGET